MKIIQMRATKRKVRMLDDHNFNNHMSAFRRYVELSFRYRLTEYWEKWGIK